MEFEDLESLRKSSPAWKLLLADNAPLILGFLGKVFVEDNVRSISRGELVGRLDDELHALNERLGNRFPKVAGAYLDDWAAASTNSPRDRSRFQRCSWWRTRSRIWRSRRWRMPS